MSRPTVVSLFSGIGGLDLGFEAAGFHHLLAVERNDDAVQTVRANRPWNIIKEDTASICPDRFLGETQANNAGVDVLIAGPPCQPFSKAAHGMNGAAGMSDSRTTTLDDLLRAVECLLPKVLLIENVQGIAGKSDGLKFLRWGLYRINALRGTNYTFSIAKLNAADYGVPQGRKRLFLVAARDGRVFDFPTATHGENGNLPASTAWDAIGDLDVDAEETAPELSLRGKWAGLIPTIPEGKNYLWHTEEGEGEPLFKWRSRYWNFLLKLSKRLPSWTITAFAGPSTGPFHWKNRRLSVPELRRLQTIPDDYQLTGSDRSARRQIGNAVPPALATVLAAEIRRQFLGQHLPACQNTFMHHTLAPVPMPEIPAMVPEDLRNRQT